MDVKSLFSPNFYVRPLKVGSLGGHPTPGYTDPFQDGKSLQKDRILGNHGEDLSKSASSKHSNPIATEVEAY